MPSPLKSMSSIRKPTEGFGAPWYCCSSPMPRIWKYRGSEVSPAQLRFGTSAKTSSKFCCPASCSVAAFEHRDAARQFASGTGLKRGRDDDLVQLRASPPAIGRSPGRAMRSSAPGSRQRCTRNGRIFLPTLPPPVLTGSGSMGLPVRVLRTLPASQALKATPACSSLTLSD